jgi:trimeric autotransporter adhesin
MKTKLLLSVILSFSFGILFSQIPQGLNYQALAGDASGNPIRNTDLQVKINILSDTLPEVIVWEELHPTVRTNAHGIFSLVVGSGVRQSSSSSATFGEISWSEKQLFIKTSIYYQSAWRNMGSAKIWTVPYAMVAGTLTGTISKLGVKGVTTSPDSTLFEVKNKNGQTVFAVYNEGVRVYVDDGKAKGSKGGFAIGGFGSEKAGVSQNLMTVTSDSVRIYVDETSAKGSKGGFAIGGFNTSKGTLNEFMFLTPENYFIGHKSGQLVNGGMYNSTLGYESGKSLTSGSNNIFVGYQSGLNNDIGSSNVFIGNAAGLSNSSGNYNIILGRSAGYDNTSGWGNVIMGDYAGSNNISGYQNVIVGDLAGLNNTDGKQNVFIGASSGYSNTGGSYNAFVGAEVGKNNSTGNYNTFFGYQAGFSSGLSSYSTSIGYRAGYLLSDWQAGTYVGFEAGLNSTGRQNVFIGSDAGQAFSTGADNVAIGAGAGGSNENPLVTGATGSRNAFMGYYTGYKCSAATDNVIIGAQNPFGATHITGSYNVYLGVDAGNLSSTGSRNVFIGYAAGLTETGSDKLYVTNNSGTTPLIWGDFGLARLRFNGNTSINGTSANSYFALEINQDANDTYGLVVYGPAWCSSGTWTGSDIRLKKNITPVMNALNSVLALKGVNFDWNIEQYPGMGFKDTKQVGFIAQDVEKVIPELVIEGPDGFKSIDYSKISPVLVEAIKEQQKLIENQENEIKSLKSELQQIKILLVRNGIK